MKVKSSRCRACRPMHRLTRTLATALLITLLISVPAAATMDRPVAFIATEER